MLAAVRRAAIERMASYKHTLRRLAVGRERTALADSEGLDCRARAFAQLGATVRARRGRPPTGRRCRRRGRRRRDVRRGRGRAGGGDADRRGARVTSTASQSWPRARLRRRCGAGWRSTTTTGTGRRSRERRAPHQQHADRRGVRPRERRGGRSRGGAAARIGGLGRHPRRASSSAATATARSRSPGWPTTTGRTAGWGTLAGAAVGVLFPPSLIGSAVVGGAAGVIAGRRREPVDASDRRCHLEHVAAVASRG